jgi:hypothetical protein
MAAASSSKAFAGQFFSVDFLSELSIDFSLI